MILSISIIKNRGDSMSAKYHINNEGNVARCNAKTRPCPFGGSEKHFSSQEEAEDARNREYEKEFHVISFIDKNNVDNEEEADALAKLLRGKIHEVGKVKAGRENLHGLKEFTDTIDFNYILYASNPERLKDDSIKKFRKISKAVGITHSENKKSAANILNNFYKIEDTENEKMEEFIKKDVTETNDLSLDTSIGMGASLLSIFSFSNKVSGKIQRVEKENVGLSKQDLKTNEEIKEKRRSIEAAKEDIYESAINPHLDSMNNYTNSLNKMIDDDLKVRANAIRNIDNRTEALRQIEELKEMQSRVYISKEGKMNLTHRFREAEKSRDSVAMRSCNRLVNMFSDEKSRVSNLFDERINEMAFEENFKKLNDDEIFDTKSFEDFRADFLELRKNIVHCFDT